MKEAIYAQVQGVGHQSSISSRTQRLTFECLKNLDRIASPNVGESGYKEDLLRGMSVICWRRVHTVRQDEAFPLDRPADIFPKLLRLAKQEPQFADEAGGPRMSFYILYFLIQVQRSFERGHHAIGRYLAGIAWVLHMRRKRGNELVRGFQGWACSRSS